MTTIELHLMPPQTIIVGVRFNQARRCSRGLRSVRAGRDLPMHALDILAIVALLAGIVLALSQKVWPVALLCLGLFLAVLADAGVIPAQAP
jgi:hypothetical protein